MGNITVKNFCYDGYSCITGTGKSETGAHIAYVFAQLNQALNGRSSGSGYKCVLYCGPSNKSVDVVLSKLKYAIQHNLLLPPPPPPPLLQKNSIIWQGHKIIQT